MVNLSVEQTKALLSSQNIKEIIQPELTNSVVLDNCRTVRMSSGTARLPVLASVPEAAWVSTSYDSAQGAKPVSAATWSSKDLVAEELAVIVPVHENIISDSDFDIWGEIQPLVNSEFGRALDAAVLFGKNKPASWKDHDLLTGAKKVNNVVQNLPKNKSFDLGIALSTAMSQLEATGYSPDLICTSQSFRGELRGLRDNNGSPIYLDSLRDGGTDTIYGRPIAYASHKMWDPAVSAIVCDPSRIIVGIREDVSIKILDQATLTSNQGTLNLAQMDMVALRMTFRVAYAVATPDSEFPASVVLAPAAPEAA